MSLFPDRALDPNQFSQMTFTTADTTITYRPAKQAQTSAQLEYNGPDFQALTFTGDQITAQPGPISTSSNSDSIGTLVTVILSGELNVDSGSKTILTILIPRKVAGPSFSAVGLKTSWSWVIPTVGERATSYQVLNLQGVGQ
jgi:hypothetical protein